MPEYNKYLGMLESGAIQGVLTGVNNMLSRQQSDYDRKENHLLNERAAEAADQRTRALYKDIYSPQALMEQYKKAGLSPSLMFGGTPGQGGMSGAQAAGATGPQSVYTPLSMIEAAEVANLNAQTKKTEAETKNVIEDTEIKNIQKRLQNLNLQEYKIEYDIAATMWQDKQGNWISAYEIASKSNNYDEFLKSLRDSAKDAGQESYIMQMSQEQGQKVLRQIYLNSNRFETEIAELTTAEVSAKFQENIIKCLEEQDFEKQNAETVAKQLKAAGEGADLTEEQKGAWNRIIQRLQKKNSTAADYIIVASMIVNQAMSNWKMPDINFNQKNINNTKNTY